MKKGSLLAGVGGVVAVTALMMVGGADEIPAQQKEKLVGILLMRGDDNAITCKFAYKGIKGRRRTDATDFCNANIDAVRAFGKAAILWDQDNPVQDAGLKRHFDSLKAELESAGYRVTNP